MTATGPALPCPSCKRVLGAHTWHDEHSGRCSHCTTEFDFFPFPALTAVRTRAVPQAAAVAEDSVCFFHGENRAEVVCEDCGRMLCVVCAVNMGGRKVCPSCIATARDAQSSPVARERLLYDSLALTLAIAPILIWFFTLVTAPIALGFVIYGWKKPGSLVRGSSKVRFVVAGTIAAIEIGAWVTGFGFLLTKR
jgi:hypothetical protein